MKEAGHYREHSVRFHSDEIPEQVELICHDGKQISGGLGQAPCGAGGGWGEVGHPGSSGNLPER